MKKNVLNYAGRALAAKIMILSAVAFIFVACEKEDITLTEKLAITEKAGTDDETGDVKRGNRAPKPDKLSIAKIAIDRGFTELVGALSYVDEELETGLVDLFLNGTDQYTVFAPTNDAFGALYETLKIDTITDLPATTVRDVLFYHVVEGRRAANSVVPPVRPREINTLLGVSFTVDSDAIITDIFGQEIGIEKPNISASNGIIHVINGVLLPLEN